MIIFLFIIIVLLLIIAAGVCRTAAESKQRYIRDHPARYYLDAGIIRIFWAAVTLVAGIGFPPLWILTLFLFIYGLHCFGVSKKLRAGSASAPAAAVLPTSITGHHVSAVDKLCPPAPKTRWETIDSPEA